jgi:membrane protein, MarC family
MDLLQDFIIAFTSVFVIVNPLSGLFTFMSMTSGYPHKAKIAYSKKSILLAMSVALFFAVAGSLVLKLFSIDINALRVAGGIILITVGLNMMKSKIHPTGESSGLAESNDKDFWVFPIAIPLLCGPGTISTVIILTGGIDTLKVLVVLAAIISVYAVAFIMFRSSETIEKHISFTGMLVITRLLGLLLSAIAVGMIMAGLNNYFIRLLSAFFGDPMFPIML